MQPIKHLLTAVAGAGLLALLTGCSTVSIQSTSYLGTPNYPPTDPVSVEILQTAPTKPHVRLGEITAEPSGSPTKQEIQQKLQVAAAKMGANAVVIVSDRTQIMGAAVVGGWYDREVVQETGRVIVAVAIRYTEPQPTQSRWVSIAGFSADDSKINQDRQDAANVPKPGSADLRSGARGARLVPNCSLFAVRRSGPIGRPLQVHALRTGTVRAPKMCQIEDRRSSSRIGNSLVWGLCPRWHCAAASARRLQRLVDVAVRFTPGPGPRAR